MASRTSCRSNADLLRADTILVCDTGNAAVGVPAVTASLRGMVNVVVHVEALPSEVHSGMFGGPAPDALAALVAMLASLRDADGNTTITGLDNTQTWRGRRTTRTPSGATPGSPPVSRCWAPAPSPTCSGPARPSPSWASTARRWSGPRPRSCPARAPG